jgi:hypothetical protein
MIESGEHWLVHGGGWCAEETIIASRIAENPEKNRGG